MLKIEKTVFISYRRTNIFHARAIYQDLRANGYDVFLDYEAIDSGDFEQIILNQIRARAHFIIILTPSALERCTNPNDWLRREIETAIDEKRNIIPLMFEGFDWKDMTRYLVGKMSILNTYNALRIPSDFFDEAMNRLRTRFLNIPIDAVLHPTPKADENAVAQKIAVADNQPPVTEKQLSASEYFERGNQHFDLGNYDMAIADYTEAIHLNPQYANAYYGRGNAYYKKRDYDHAIANYTEAIRRNPQFAIAYKDRGRAYYNKRDYERAIADLDKAIRLNPQDSDTYNLRGMVHMYGKREYVSEKFENGIIYLDSAIADFERALQIDPNHEIARNNREHALGMKRGLGGGGSGQVLKFR